MSMAASRTAVEMLVAEFMARLSALGISSIRVKTDSEHVEELSGVVVFGSNAIQVYSNYFDLEHGNSDAICDPDTREKKELCVNDWAHNWPPSPTDARTSPPPVRHMPNAIAPRYDNGDLTGWFLGSQAPKRDGLYFVRNSDAAGRLSSFMNGEWLEGVPEEWRGIKVRFSEARRKLFTKAYRESGDIDALAMLFREAHSLRESSEDGFSVHEKWSMRAAVYAHVLYRSLPGQNLVNAILQTVSLPSAEKDVIAEIHRRANAFIAGENF